MYLQLCFLISPLLQNEEEDEETEKIAFDGERVRRDLLDGRGVGFCWTVNV